MWTQPHDIGNCRVERRAKWISRKGQPFLSARIHHPSAERSDIRKLFDQNGLIYPNVVRVLV